MKNTHIKEDNKLYGRAWYHEQFVKMRREYRAKTQQSIFSPNGVQYPDETYTDLDVFIKETIIIL